ncbi:hypothetical protein [Thiocapsa rosea]|uniref:hypothetical protein n=1 Tax=Thiocapsa rosea TaxID=69360 RepID=UPI001FE425FA|nr:hypothetical protein [Thiocapsa rosea]
MVLDPDPDLDLVPDLGLGLGLGLDLGLDLLGRRLLTAGKRLTSALPQIRRAFLLQALSEHF